MQGILPEAPSRDHAATPGTEKILEFESKGASLEEPAPHISGEVSGPGGRQGTIDKGMYPVFRGVSSRDKL